VPPAPAAPVPTGRARPVVARQPAARPAPRVGRRAPPAADYPFPIEDYDYLSVREILPLLPELDDQEMVEVLLYEQAGSNRGSIIKLIDALLEGEDV
jgi:hypothetical protein